MTLPAHHVISWFGRRTFRNLPSWTGWEEKTLSSVLRWVAERRHKNLPSGGWLEASASAVPTAAQLASSLPASPPDYELLASPPPGGVQATWIGHSTSLVQLEGVAFLTDPVFAPRCSPFSWLGPLRATPPALDIFQPRCPAPRFVLISHAHYDHLCEPSVLALHAKFPALRWFVPLGLATWFRSRGISGVTELDWWQTAAVGEGGLTVACTPAQHWSSRSLFDRNTTLWASWAVMGAKKRFFFAGDSGHCPVFEEIGAKYGPFCMATIPIGAYEPRSFHGPSHMDPREAVAVHTALRAKKSMAIHWGTWALTDEALDAPPRLLASEAAKAGLAADAFVSVRHGATIRLE